MKERVVRKKVEESDTCRDCWRTRFRKDLMDTISGQDPPKYLNEQITLREKLYDQSRAEARELYEEIAEIRALAGDVFMGRYPEEEN